MSTEYKYPPFLSVAEAADYLRLSPRTLDNLRSSGGGPRYRKHGGKVIYALEALEEWSRARERSSTSN